jgi:hypothetical protein
MTLRSKVKVFINSQKYRSTYYISTARHKLSSDNLFKMCVELRTMLEPDGPVDCKLMNPRHTRVSGFCVSLSVLTCPPLFRCRCNSVARAEAPVLSLGGHLTLSHLLAYRFKDSDFWVWFTCLVAMFFAWRTPMCAFSWSRSASGERKRVSSAGTWVRNGKPSRQKSA